MKTSYKDELAFQIQRYEELCKEARFSLNRIKELRDQCLHDEENTITHFRNTKDGKVILKQECQICHKTWYETYEDASVVVEELKKDNERLCDENEKLQKQLFSRLPVFDEKAFERD